MATTVTLGKVTVNADGTYTCQFNVAPLVGNLTFTVPFNSSLAKTCQDAQTQMTAFTTSLDAAAKALVIK